MYQTYIFSDGVWVVDSKHSFAHEHSSLLEHQSLQPSQNS